MQVAGVRLLDWSLDADHNRSVVTVAGSPEAVREAAICAVGKAAELIDLTRQTGVHPRIGAADVIPFVPVANVKLEQCALLARQAGRRYGSGLGCRCTFTRRRRRGRTGALWRMCGGGSLRVCARRR